MGDLGAFPRRFAGGKRMVAHYPYPDHSITHLLAETSRGLEQMRGRLHCPQYPSRSAEWRPSLRKISQDLTPERPRGISIPSRIVPFSQIRAEMRHVQFSPVPVFNPNTHLRMVYDFMGRRVQDSPTAEYSLSKHQIGRKARVPDIFDKRN